MSSKYAEDIATVKADVKWLKEAMRTHQSQHFKVYIMFFGSIFGAGLALLIALV